MSLRLRLTIMVAVAVASATILFGGAAYGLFVGVQDRQLRELVNRDLDRIEALLRDPVVGATLLRSEETAYVEQFVSIDGLVVLPQGEEALPLYETPTLVRAPGAPRMVGSTPWLTAGGAELGTIRLGLDVSDALAARATLVSVLAWSGAAIAAVVALASVLMLRGALRPLAGLASQARAVDPARPEPTTYQGPDDEVAAVASALNDALAAIRARQDAERASLAEVAHELAAPLTVVAGQLAVLARSRPDDPRVRAADDAAQELLHTSQDLLTLARGELEQPFTFAVVDLASIAAQVADGFPGIEGHVDGGPAAVVGDANRLKQLTRNLLRNAIQATGAGSGVTWRVGSRDGTVMLTVTDRGPGIAEADLPKVFERFYSGHGGPGIGLAVAQRIAERHEGRIEVRSAVGEGAVFRVLLPDADSRMADPQPD